MIAVRAFSGRQVAVFGLGKSGIASARALAAGGADVRCWDDNEAAREAALKVGLTLDDLTARDWATFAALVVAPGVPLTHPEPHRVVQLARMTGVPILGDVELFQLALDDTPESARPKVVAITGTNGKSTTTALLGHVIASAGRDAQVGGNIGTPMLALEPFHAGAVYVLEVSSFQLDLTQTFAPDVAILLNIAPDHLDRHGTMENYIAAKARIFEHQGPAGAAVIGVDDPHTQRLATELMGHDGPRVIPISAYRALGKGVHAVGGMLYDAIDPRKVREMADLRTARALPGRHTWQNAAAAFAAARALGVDARTAVKAIMDFGGLAHRVEEVARIGRVRFVNDSKATNAAAAKQALGAYETIFWIAGGRAKGDGLGELLPLMSRVARAYLIGEAAEAMAAQLHGRAPVEISRTLETALEKAAADAAASTAPAPVVLLSPACASFDQFKSFEARGDAFRALVLSLPGAASGQAAQ